MNRSAIEKLRRATPKFDINDELSAAKSLEVAAWNAAIAAVLALEDDVIMEGSVRQIGSKESLAGNNQYPHTESSTIASGDARKALIALNEFDNNWVENPPEANYGSSSVETIRSALTPAPEIEGHDPDKCLGGLSCPVCSDLKTLVERAFNNGFDGWFGDEDPNGDRDHGYFLQLDDYEKIKEFLKAARQTLGREG